MKVASKMPFPIFNLPRELQLRVYYQCPLSDLKRIARTSHRAYSMVQRIIDEKAWLRIVCMNAWTRSRHLELTLERLEATREVLRSRVRNLCVVLPYTLQRRRTCRDIEAECAAVFQWLVLKRDLEQLVFILRPTPTIHLLPRCPYDHPLDFLWSCTAQWTESSRPLRKLMIFSEEGDHVLRQTMFLRMDWDERYQLRGPGPFIHDLVVCIAEKDKDSMPRTIAEWLAQADFDIGLLWFKEILIEGHGLRSFRFVFYYSNMFDKRRGYPQRDFSPCCDDGLQAYIDNYCASRRYFKITGCTTKKY